MKHCLQIFTILALVGLTFCSRAAHQPKASSLTLTLYSGDFCGPCQELAEEMRQQGIHESLNVDSESCPYAVHIEHINVTDFDGMPPGKMTNILPEHNLKTGDKTLGYDNYSDLYSIRAWIINTVKDAKLNPCG